MTKKSKGEKTKATVQVRPKEDLPKRKGERVVTKHGITWVDRIDAQIVETKKKPTNVYSADYKLIDDTIEEIKKASRKVSTNDYSTNNVYIFLQNALKRVLDAEK